jgi:hypothetical protein
VKRRPALGGEKDRDKEPIGRKIDGRKINPGNPGLVFAA